MLLVASFCVQHVQMLCEKDVCATPAQLNTQLQIDRQVQGASHLVEYVMVLTEVVMQRKRPQLSCSTVCSEVAI